MNWTAKAETWELSVVDRHLFMSEECQMHGACALKEHSELLAAAVEGFVRSLDWLSCFDVTVYVWSPR